MQASLTQELKLALTQGVKAQRKVFTMMVLGMPFVLMVAAYLMDSEMNMSKQGGVGILNTARHAFSCSMRLPSLTAEWFLLGVPTAAAGATIFWNTSITW